MCYFFFEEQLFLNNKNIKRLNKKIISFLLCVCSARVFTRPEVDGDFLFLLSPTSCFKAGSVTETGAFACAAWPWEYRVTVVPAFTCLLGV